MPTLNTTRLESRLSIFFAKSDTEFGIFYPKHYLLASFPNLADAQRAKTELLRSGRDDLEVIAAPGEEVVQYAEEYLVKHGLWGLLMTALSRAIGTEAVYADQDLAAAKAGAAFVAVYCPSDDAKVGAWKVLQPRHPLMARYYSAGGIEHLADEN